MAKRSQRLPARERAYRAHGKDTAMMIRQGDVLRVHPECRPLFASGKLGAPQELTALNAIASTFGKTGKQYRLAAET